jgi:hypothetical protein
MAPVTDRTIATLIPANINGIEFGSRIFLKTSNCDARLIRANSKSSGSTSLSPTTVFTTMGKNATRKAIAILDISPYPTQITMSGAKALFGMA